MLAPPLEGWRPLLRGILYPPLIIMLLLSQCERALRNSRFATDLIIWTLFSSTSTATIRGVFPLQFVMFISDTPFCNRAVMMSTFPLLAAECKEVQPVPFCWHGFAPYPKSTSTILSKFASESEILIIIRIMNQDFFPYTPPMKYSTPPPHLYRALTLALLSAVP